MNNWDGFTPVTLPAECSISHFIIHFPGSNSHFFNLINSLLDNCGTAWILLPYSALNDIYKFINHTDLHVHSIVEISPNAEPPVCKIMDYKKFIYEQKKRDKVLKAKSTQVVVKEIRFGPQTDEHDYEFKRKNAEKFLKEGAKLKAFVFFKGRSIIYKDQGQILLLRLATDLEEFGKVEAMPVLEGKRMIMFIAPKKKK